MMSKAELIFAGDEYFSQVLHAIENAEKEIFFETYIFDFDEIGEPLLVALRAAAARGVRVHLLVDGIGSMSTANKLLRFPRSHHFQIRIFHALPPSLLFRPRFSMRALRRTIYFLRRVNKRNHRKMVMVDQRWIFVGSLNVTKVHSEKFSGKMAWRDTAIRIEEDPNSTEVQDLRVAFLQAWNQARYFGRSGLRDLLLRKTKLPMPKQTFRLNNHTWWRFRLLRDLNYRIKNAQHRICITNAYFIPRKSILRNLRKVARKGCEVNLLLPAKTDFWFVREASRSLYYRLLKDGVRIFEYGPNMLHAKTLTIDNWATVGSHNLNHRSLVHDLEVEVMIDQPELLQQLHAQWNKDLQTAQPILWDDLNKTFFLRRWVGRMLYWFRFWI